MYVGMCNCCMRDEGRGKRGQLGMCAMVVSVCLSGCQVAGVVG